MNHVNIPFWAALTALARRLVHDDPATTHAVQRAVRRNVEAQQRNAATSQEVVQIIQADNYPHNLEQQAMDELMAKFDKAEAKRDRNH